MSNRPWLTGLTPKSLPCPTDSSALGPELPRTAQDTPHPGAHAGSPPCLSPCGSPAHPLAGLRPLCGSPCLFPAAVTPLSRHTCLGYSLQPVFFLSRGLEAESAWESGQSSGLAWNKAVLGPQLSSPGTRWVWGRALTRLSPADLENHQHARALACRRASLCCLPGARVQDS